MSFAFEENLKNITGVAGADLTGKQYLCVKLNSSEEIVACSAITDKTVGILQDEGKQGKALPVAVGGICKAKAGATIAAGDPVATKADGTLQVAATTQYVIGVARTGGSSGQVISVLLQPAVLKA
jgi:hypothetical protein